MRNGIIINNLTNVDILEKKECGGNNLEVFQGFFCHNIEYNPYTDFTTDNLKKRDLFKARARDLPQDLAEMIGLPVYCGNFRNKKTKNINALLRLGWERILLIASKIGFLWKTVI